MGFYAEQEKKPMILAISGTIFAGIVIALLWWLWQSPADPQQVNAWHTSQGEPAPAYRSEPAVE